MRSLLLSSACLLTFSLLHADSSQQPEIEKNSRLQFGGTYSYVHISPTDDTSTNGSLGGIQAIYEYRPENQIYTGLEFTWREGPTRGNDTKRTVLEFDVQERLGYTFSWEQDQFRLAPFTGLGYRYLGENLTTTSTVSFNYNEMYVPIGFLFDSRINSMFTLGLNFQWMPQIFPTVTIKPLDGARWDLTYPLANFLVEVPFGINVSDEYSLTLLFVPFFESWHDGKTVAETTTGLTLDVPKNAYLFGGINVNLAYKF